MGQPLTDATLTDELGWELLTHLQRDGRLSYTDLGRRVNVSIPTVADRLRRMQTAGIITGYFADVDPKKLGLMITAFVQITAKGRALGRIAEQVKKCPEVVEYHRTTGAWQIMIKVNARSVEHLESVLNRFARYGTLSSSIVLASPLNRRAISNPQNARRRHLKGV